MNSGENEQCASLATLVFYMAQIYALSGWSAVANAADAAGDQATDYQAAVELGQKASLSEKIGIGVWSASALCSGKVCFDFLITLRSARQRLVTTAEAVKKAGDSAATSCPEAMTKATPVLSQEYQAIVKSHAQAEGAARKGAQEKAQTPGQVSDARGFPRRLPLPLSFLSLWTSESHAGAIGSFVDSIYTSVVPDPPPETTGTVLRNYYGDSLRTDLNRDVSGDALTRQNHLLGNVEDTATAPPSGVSAQDYNARLKANLPESDAAYNAAHPDQPPQRLAADAPPPAAPKKPEVAAKPAENPGADKEGKENAPEKESPADQNTDPSVDPYKADESLASAARQMANTAKQASDWAYYVAGANSAQAVSCNAAAAALKTASQPLAAQADSYDKVIKNIVSYGKICGVAAAGAAATDAGLSIGLAKDTTAGLIGLAGAAPVAIGLAASIFQKHASTDQSAATSGVMGCVMTATSLAEVAVKVVELKKTDESTDKNKQQLEDLGSHSWLEQWYLPWEIPEARAATGPGLANACGRDFRSPMARYSCALAGDDRLRNVMSQAAGGGEGMFRATEQIYGISRNEFLSATQSIDMGRVIGLMTSRYPGIAPGVLSLYASAERKAADMLKLPRDQRAAALSGGDGSLLLDRSLPAEQSVEDPDHGPARLTAAGRGSDPFANREPATATDEPPSLNQTQRAPCAEAVPLPPAPGLGVDEISPAEGRSLFELVTRTIRDHRELAADR